MSRNRDPEVQLLHRIAHGDRVAFEELYRDTAPWLTVRLRRRCRDDKVVSEVLQETYLAVWRAAGGFAGTGDVAGWIWTIAARRLIDAFRRRARLAEPAPRAAAVPDEPSAEDQVLGDLLDDGLATARSGLSPELRAVLQATVLDGFSIRETSVLLGVPENTVKTGPDGRGCTCSERCSSPG